MHDLDDLVLDDKTDDSLTLSARVTARAHDGEANDALRRLVAERLAVSRSRVTIVRGDKSRDKIVTVESLSAAEGAAVLESGD